MRPSLEKILRNNGVDVDTMIETLQEIKETTFGWLYNLQKNSTMVHRFDFKTSDFEFNKIKTNVPKRKFTLNINENFITVNKRNDFRKSKFYRKEFTAKDILTHPEILKDLSWFSSMENYMKM